MQARAYYSPIQICRVALSLLGANPINSFDDKTTEAVLCRDTYPFARDSVLEEYEWKFARRTGQLNLLDDDPPPDRPDYRWFQLPSDTLRVIQVLGPDMPYRWGRYGLQLLVNTSETLQVEYTPKDVEASLFSPSFAYAVSCKLAVMMADALTGNPALTSAMNNLYGQALAVAVVNDAKQEDTPQSCADNPLVEAALRA